MCVILKLSILECEVNQDNTFFLQWVHYILERTFVDDFSFCCIKGVFEYDDIAYHAMSFDCLMIIVRYNVRYSC